MKPVGEPYAGNPHVRFDERGWETERCRMAQATAPILDSTYAGIYCGAAKGPLLKTQRTCQQASPLQQRASNVVFCDIGWSYETLFLSGVRSARFT
jgi:hypothetical protein